MKNCGMLKAVVLGVALCGATGISLAADEGESALKTLKERMPDAKIRSIRKLPNTELFEVVANGVGVFYTDRSGEIALFGNAVELKGKVNLTQKRIEELRATEFGKLPLDKAVVRVKGNGSRKLAIFADPDCPFCRQLERELDKISDVTLYVFLLPLAELHPDAVRKAEAVWCAQDKGRAWEDVMLRNLDPAGTPTDCSAPIEEIAKLADTLMIDGTPGLVFSNGKIVPGVPPAQRIEEMLSLAAQGS